MLARVRSYFLAGLLVVVPAGVTAAVIYQLALFLESVIQLVPAAWRPEALFGRPIPGLGILVAVLGVLLAGVVAENFLGRRIVSFYEAILLRMPMVSPLYGGVKQLLEQLFAADRRFHQVVLIEWPRRGLYSVAFQTGVAALDRGPGEKMVNVFLPSTPNPTTGFYFMIPEADVIQTEMSVEEAFKLIMSAGIVAPPGRLSAPPRVL